MKKILLSILALAAVHLSGQTLANVQRNTLLTSGRIPVSTTNGIVTDYSTLTFNSGTGALNATTFVGAFSGSLASGTGLPIGGISATGTPSSTTFLRGDGQWTTPAGGGNVSNTGTPTSGQLASWTSATVIQGITTGTGILTALGVNTGSAGAPVLFNGALGTPSSGTVTNLTGTASININGTVGANTPNTGAFTTGVFGSTTSLLVGTAGSAVGNVGFRNATSGTATLAPPTGALGTYTVTLPNAASTLPIFGQQITFAGPTAARTITLPDAAFTVARTDAAQTFTGVQSFGSAIGLASSATPTTTAAQMAFDNNAWATNFGAVQVHNGTANTWLVGVEATDTPTNGQVPTWNTGGTITWETVAGSGTVASGTTNTLAKYTAATTVGNSLLSDNATTLTYTGTGGITASGPLTAGGSGAGAVVLPQGSTQSAGTTNITLQAPASVTSYVLTLPGAVGAAGTVLTDAAGNGVLSWAASGSGTGANPSATIGLTAVNGAATSYLRSDGAPALSQAIAPTWTAVHNFSPTARSSGVAPAFLFTTPADTAQTASTESIGFSKTAATRQHATGALTLQREVVFAAPTNSFVGASALTTAVNVDIADPVSGTNATVTSNYGLRVNNALATGVISNSGTEATLAAAMGALAIDVTKEMNTKSISVDSTFTFSGTPGIARQWFAAEITNTDTNAHTLTIPSSFSSATQAARTSIPIAASGKLYLTWNYDGSVYNVYGDPTLVGTVISSSIATGSAVTLTTATAANVTSVSITPGTWQVTGVIYFKPASATSTLFETTIGTTTAAMSTTVPQFTSLPLSTTTSSVIVSQVVPTQTITVTSNTTYYLVAKQTFSAGTSAAFGDIRAIRIQ